MTCQSIYFVYFQVRGEYLADEFISLGNEYSMLISGAFVR